jgi:hypothetical protein
MKQIARKAGAPTDASRNYEFTDWNALDQFVERSLVPRVDPLAGSSNSTMNAGFKGEER